MLRISKEREWKLKSQNCELCLKNGDINLRNQKWELQKLLAKAAENWVCLLCKTLNQISNQSWKTFQSCFPRSTRHESLCLHRLLQSYVNKGAFCRCRLRSLLSQSASGCSILPKILALDTSDETKAFLSLDTLPSKNSASSFDTAASRKLKKVCNETKV